MHRRTGSLVALKNLEHQRFPTHRFLRELRFLLSLQHPNIVTCQALEHTRTGRYLVMDYCAGGTLRNLMTDSIRVSVHQSVQIVMDILNGLDHAHSRNIIHCDIKPENILLTLQPKGWITRISDFGIARLCQELSAEEAGNTGSPAYMAPERFYGQHSTTADVYAVGILLYELLTGHRPFSGTPGELMSAHLNTPVSLPESVPENLRPILHTALQKLSARRFHSARDMLTALQGTWETAVQLDTTTQAYSIRLVSQPLFHKTQAVPQCLIQPQWSQPLKAPCTSIGALTQADGALMIWYATDRQLIYQIGTPITGDRPSLESHHLSNWQTVEWPTSIQTLCSHEHGWLAFSRDQAWAVEGKTLPTVTPVARLKCKSQSSSENQHTAIVEEQGRWAAILELAHVSDANTGVGSGMLWFQRLSNSDFAGVVSDRPITLTPLGHSSERHQLVKLDARHVGVVSTPIVSARSEEKSESTNTRIEIFTRRGDRLSSLMLPIQLDQVTSTKGLYRLIATESGNHQWIITIDLKPFRMWRSPLEIVPKFLAVASWGTVVVDANGRIVLLDQNGHMISSVDGPTDPTAIALHDTHTLLVATWNSRIGQLYHFNLNATGIDQVLSKLESVKTG